MDTKTMRRSGTFYLSLRTN
ncbi:erythromycin resistance leader peptide [TM7 phylum sp. oral taxon 352]|nr:erythromycin resistance leader peptide [TM7 phylum sp. oral taxon 352]